MLKRLQSFIRWLRTGEGFFPAMPEVPKVEVSEIIAAQSAWTLAQALLAKVEKDAPHGAKEQMRNALGQLFRSGGQWLYLTEVGHQK